MTYEERITIAGLALRAKFPPAGWIATVDHDNDCPGARNKPPCRCEPDITLEGEFGRYRVSSDGELVEVA